MSADVVIPAWCWDAATLAMAEGAAENLRETCEADVIMVYAGVEPSAKLRQTVELVEMNPPQGWAFASNLGLYLSTADFVVVGSVDVRVPHGWLEKMLAAAHGGRTIVSPRDHKADGTRRRWDVKGRGSFWGAWFMLPRAALEEVGYLDGYKMRRMADMDWAIRARKAGFKTARADVAAVHVAPHHTLKRFPDPYDEVMVRLFKKRHEGHGRLGTWEAGK